MGIVRVRTRAKKTEKAEKGWSGQHQAETGGYGMRQALYWGCSTSGRGFRDPRDPEVRLSPKGGRSGKETHLGGRSRWGG